MKKLLLVILILAISQVCVHAEIQDIGECKSADNFQTPDPNPSLICAETWVEACALASEKKQSLTAADNWYAVNYGCAYGDYCLSSYQGSVHASLLTGYNSNGSPLYDFYSWYYFAQKCCDDMDGDGNCDEEEETDCNPQEEFGGSGFCDKRKMCCPNDNKTCPKTEGGNPVNFISGNNVEKEIDLEFSSSFEKGFSFIRKYKSRFPEDSPIGLGWSHNYNIRIEPYQASEGGRFKIQDESNRIHHFQDPDLDGVYTGMYSNTSYVVSEPDGSLTWYRGNGIKYIFNDQDKLIAKVDGNGNTLSLSYDAQGRLETITDQTTGRSMGFAYNVDDKIDHITGPVTSAVADGIWVSYQYDANLNLVRVEYADDNNGSAASGFEYKYEDPYDVNNLTEKRNLAGEFLSSWAYDSSDRAYENITRDGKGITISYGTSTVAVTDAQGAQKTYTFQKFNGLRKITDITGDSGCAGCGEDVVRYEYDDQLRVKEVEYANGRIDQYADFDVNDRYQTEIQAVGTADERTITYTLHPITGKWLSVTEASVLGQGDKVTIFDYDNDGNATPNENPTRLMRRKIERGFTLDSAGAVVAYEYITILDYNAKGQVTGIDGPLPGDQDKITFTYDAVTGDLLSQTVPLAGTTDYTYDAAGQVETITDVNNIITTIDYDGRKRPVSVTRNGVTTSLTYTAAGEPDAVTDALNRTLDYVYNPEGFLEKIVDPRGDYTFNDYNTLGQLIESSVYNAAGTQTLFSAVDYGDPAGNPDLLSGKPWKTIRRNHDDSADLETVYAYDAGGNLKAVTDANTHTTAYDYDLFDRLQQVTQPGSVITTYSYDSQGNLTAVTDAAGHATSYLYDDMGRLVKSDSPDTGITAYVYDEAGNLRYKTQNSQTTAYQYDVVGRLTNIIYADSTQNVTLTYDSGAGANLKGRLATVTDPSGDVEYSYDDDGNMEMETRTVNGVAFVTGYGYDAAGNLRSITYPTGQIIAFTPDATDPARIASVVLDGTTTLASGIDYAPFGPATAMTLGNGMGVTRTLDKNYQVRTLAAGTVLDRTYTPDAVGNIEVITDNLDSARSQSFGYDALYRLTNANGIYGAIDFTYDQVGNRTTRVRTGAAASDDSYFYVPGTNLLQAVVGTHPELIAYDADGNTTTRTPGAANPVPAITDPADYTYNSGGQRALKDATSDKIFHYDLAGQLIAETDGLGNLIKAYVWLHGQPLAQIAADGSVTYYHNDHLGTPQKMTDSSGTVVWAADYLPFGQADVIVGTVENNLRFAGQYYDAETGLHYNYHRYYDPSLGRYLRADPIGHRGGINLYSYVKNNPVNLVDLRGLESLTPEMIEGFVPAAPIDSLIGSKPGDIFTIGFSVSWWVGTGISFDRIIMPNGEVDWFWTWGFGAATPGFAFSMDRGSIAKLDLSSGCPSLDYDNPDFTKDDILGHSLSINFDYYVVGAEASFIASGHPLYVQTKGGLRISTAGANLYSNWTWDLR